MVQDRAIFTMADQQKVMYSIEQRYSIVNNLERPKHKFQGHAIV